MAAIAELPKRPMIPPEEQLRSLALPTVWKSLYDTGVFPEKEIDRAIKFAARSILMTIESAAESTPKPMASQDIDFKETDFKEAEVLPAQPKACNPFLDKVIADTTQLILKPLTTEGPETQVSLLTDIALGRLVGPDPLPPALTNWYKALNYLDLLPNKIPALPLHIFQALNDECRVHIDKRIVQTHFLYLIPPGAVNELEKRVGAYGQQLYGPNPNPLAFRYFWDPLREEHANVQFHEYEWILILNDVLPGSRDQPYEEQAQMVADLSEESSLDYQVPTFREAIAAIFLHRVATGESLFQETEDISTYTRIKEVTRNWHTCVGGSNPYGVQAYHGHHPHKYIGVAPLLK